MIKMPQEIEIPNLTDSQKIYKALVENLMMLNTSIGKIQEQQKAHHKILVEGEGDDLPMLERVRNLEAFQKAIQFWFRTIAVALVLQTVAFAGAALVYFIKLYPLLEKLANQP